MWRRILIASAFTMSGVTSFTTSDALAREARAVIHVGITITGRPLPPAAAKTGTPTTPAGKLAAPAPSQAAR